PDVRRLRTPDPDGSWDIFFPGADGHRGPVEDSNRGRRLETSRCVLPGICGGLLLETAAPPTGNSWRCSLGDSRLDDLSPTQDKLSIDPGAVHRRRGFNRRNAAAGLDPVRFFILLGVR